MAKIVKKGKRYIKRDGPKVKPAKSIKKDGQVYVLADRSNKVSRELEVLYSGKPSLQTKGRGSNVTEKISLQPRPDSDRMEIRVTEDHKGLFIRAAYLRGFDNVSDYIRHIALVDANEALENSSPFSLSLKGQKAFFEALTEEPRNIPGLRKSLKEYLKGQVAVK